MNVNTVFTFISTVCWYSLRLWYKIMDMCDLKNLKNQGKFFSKKPKNLLNGELTIGLTHKTT